jgi:hypothetical protein
LRSGLIRRRGGPHRVFHYQTAPASFSVQCLRRLGFSIDAIRRVPEPHKADVTGAQYRAAEASPRIRELETSGAIPDETLEGLRALEAEANQRLDRADAG